MGCLKVFIQQISSLLQVEARTINTLVADCIALVKRPEDDEQPAKDTRLHVDAGLVNSLACVSASVVPQSLKVFASYVCTAAVPDEEPEAENYLEIEPEVIWVYPDFESMNYVFSNTTWNVN